MLSRRALFTIPKAKPVAAPAARPAPAPLTGDAYWLHLGRKAMACRFEITLPAELSHHLDAAHRALDTIDALEEQLTIFRDSSELAAINRDAADGPVAVEPRLFELLRFCELLSEESGGAFDITSTPLSRTWGFLRREGRLPSDAEITAALSEVGMDKVEFGSQMKTVRFKRTGVSLNLGGIGKGYALDRIATELYAAGVDTALLSAGRSSLRAIGAGPDGEGYQVGLRDPGDHDRRYGSLTLRNNALGVSGAGEQFFEVEGQRYGHIIDPRTGWPAAGRALVAVTAPTATEADALATAFYVAGPDFADRYTQRHPEISAVILDAASHGGRPRATFFGRKTQWRVNRAA